MKCRQGTHCGGLERNGKYDCDLVARMRLPSQILSQPYVFVCQWSASSWMGELGTGAGGIWLGPFDGRILMLPLLLRASKVSCKCFNYSLGMRFKSIEYDRAGVGVH